MISFIKYRIFLFLLVTLPLVSAGQEYFQQRTDYKINVTLNDVKHELDGYETIHYQNNSPNTLTYIYFHLWPNGYKNNSTALAKQLYRGNNLDFFYSPTSSYGFIDSLNFKVDDKSVTWNYIEDTIDVCILYLNEPLKSGNSITISTPFHVKIPGDAFSRLGRYGQSYQITQWYPKPAVYDKFGWHAFPYLNEGEFYSEYGSFDVSITVPDNYTIAATGVLQNPEEIDRLNKIAEETKKITNYNKEDLGFPVSSEKWKTLHFVQDSIHDFAWFADKRFHIIKGNVVLPYSNRLVTTWVYFTNIEGNLWKNAINYVNNGVLYYSKWVGEYPYSQCTAIESVLGAGGGMEYPMITNIGSSGNKGALEEVIVHEVGHNWFYGILGSNEREHPWMDEGINSFYEQRYTDELKKNGLYGQVNILSKYIGTKTISPFFVNRLACDYILHNGADQPLDLHSEAYPFENYGIIAYMKGAQAMNYLKNYLGTEVFDHCMKEYFNQWKFKHPYPQDLQKVLENCSGKNLEWFFNGIGKEGITSDYKIKNLKAKSEKQPTTLLIKNSGKLNAPLHIAFFHNDSLKYSEWVEGFQGQKQFSFDSISFNKAIIDPEKIMFEYKRTNNNIYNKGAFNKCEPLQIKLFGIIENPEKTQLSYMPVVGWNTSNGIMPGVLFFNPFFPERKVQYRLMPMYSTSLNEFTGIGYTEYNFYPSFFNLQKFNLFAEYNRFHTGKAEYLSAWQKLEGGINFIFKRNPAFPKRQWQGVIKTSYASDLYADTAMNLFVNASLLYKDYSKKFPVSFEINAESGPDYMKSWIDCSWGINYKDRKTGFKIRFFAGGFIFNNSNYGVYNFHLSGTDGRNDYSYNETFPDRSGLQNKANIWPHQFINNEGGFGIYTPLQTNAWMTAINMEAAFPVPVPLAFYTNIATFKDANKILDNSTTFPWEIGVELKLIKDIFVVYFPIKTSAEIKSTNELYTKTYTEKIRFTLRLSKLVPFKYINQIPLLF